MNTNVLRRFANATGPVYITQAEGSNLVSGGMITVFAETDPSNPMAYRAELTDAGRKWLAENPAPIPVYEVENVVPYIPSTRGNRKAGEKPRSPYPFDLLTAVGMSFHVPPTEEMPEPWKKLVGVANAQTKKYTKKVEGSFQTNEDGTPKLNRQGKPVPTVVVERKFVCQKAAGNDPKGIGARIFRVA